MTMLITGGTGFLGSQLARLLVERGEDIILFDINPNLKLIKEIKDKVKMISGNLANWPEVLNAVNAGNVEGVFHLGSMLSVPSQDNPWASFQANVCGTMHVLEAARLFKAKRVVFISSLATNALGIPSVVTDDTLQRPTSMYGCGKLYGELLGRFYRTRFGLDFRTLRSPTLVGPGVRTPGVTQYASFMIEYAALGKHYECYVTEDTKSSGLMYFKDAVKALDMLYQVPMEQIRTINYNVSGLRGSVTAKEIEEVVKKHIPEFSISYKPEKEVVEYLKKYKDGMQILDDTKAREEWGWEPRYNNLEGMIVDFIEEVRRRAELFGIIG